MRIVFLIGVVLFAVLIDSLLPFSTLLVALILSHPLSPEDDDDKYSKTTLIVAPVGLLGQWKLEIENKTNKRLRVVVYHGAKRKQREANSLSHPRSRGLLAEPNFLQAADVKTLHNYDVVVTNYETVSSDKASESGLFEPKRRQFHRGKPLSSSSSLFQRHEPTIVPFMSSDSRRSPHDKKLQDEKGRSLFSCQSALPLGTYWYSVRFSLQNSLQGSLLNLSLLAQDPKLGRRFVLHLQVPR